MTILPKERTYPVESSPVRWPLSFSSETATSDHVSAACYCGLEDFEVMPIVVIAAAVS